MVNGVNPSDYAFVADSTVINYVKISRYLFCISDILKRVIDDNGAIGKLKL